MAYVFWRLVSHEGAISGVTFCPWVVPALSAEGRTLPIETSSAWQNARENAAHDNAIKTTSVMQQGHCSRLLVSFEEIHNHCPVLTPLDQAVASARNLFAL